MGFGGQSAPYIRMQWNTTFLNFGTDAPIKQDELIVV
jgi:hypothetical protein